MIKDYNFGKLLQNQGFNDTATNVHDSVEVKLKNFILI